MGEAKNIYFTCLKYEVQITQSMRVKVRHVSTKSPNHFQIKDAIYFSRRHIHATVDPLSATSLIASSSFTKEKRDKRGVMGEDRLVLGAVFAAYVRDLRSWARVIVKAPNGSKEVVVFLPDHGFFCAVKIRQMWDLEPQFGKLPFQAFVASIPIVSPGLTDRWSPEAVQVFKEAVVKRQLLGQIFSITSNAEQFPAVTVVFSALYASTSNADVSHHMESHHEVAALSRDREKTVSIVDLMIENCHAKFKGE